MRKVQKRNRKILFLTALFVATFFWCDNVYADWFGDNYICLDYSVVKVDPKADSKKTKVKDIQNLTKQDLYNRHIAYPESIGKEFDACMVQTNNYKTCQKKRREQEILYEINVQYTGRSCVRQWNPENNSWLFQTCPTTADARKYDMSVITDNDHLTYTYNAATNKYDISFHPNKVRADYASVKGLKLSMAGKVAMTVDGKTKEMFKTDELGNPEKVIRENIGLGNNGTITVSLDLGTDFYFVFYIANGGICDGARIGYYQGTVPSNIPNPYKDASVCTNYKNLYKGTENEDLAKELVPLCYQDEIDGTKKTEILDEINKGIATANAALTTVQTNSTTGLDMSCEFEPNTYNPLTNENTVNKRSLVYTNFLNVGNTKYWKAYCTEKMTIEYDEPKAVNAGTGFAYQIKITLERACEPVQVALVPYYPQCSYTVECYGGPANHNGEAGAGPSKAFDTCVNSCDGGKYTQECINKCNTVTNQLSSTSNSKGWVSFMNATKETVGVLRLGVYNYNYANEGLAGICNDGGTRLPRAEGCWATESNEDCGGDGSTYCTTAHGVQFTYLDGCNANGEVGGTKCMEVYRQYPCVHDDALTNYRRRLNDSRNELNNIIAIISDYSSGGDNHYTKDETFNANVIDSYTNKAVSFSSKNDPNNNKLSVKAVNSVVNSMSYNKTQNGKNETVTLNAGKISDKILGYAVGGVSQSEIAVSVNRYIVKRVVTVDFPIAYVPSSTNNDKVKYSTTDPSTSGLNIYYNGGNKYYTNLYSPAINSYYGWRSYVDNNNQLRYFDINSKSTDSYTKNIKYVINNIGSWNQWGGANKKLDLECFYGLINKYCVSCNVKDEISLKHACNTNTDLCTTGIQYIFRPIDLNDVFPNDRDPRWNWSNASKMTLFKNYNIDPTKYTSMVEEVGSSNNTIYKNSNTAPGDDANPELDYEIYLTKGNISAIKTYNKDHENYLNYDNMSCSKNKDGQISCKSDFIGNTSYMTLYQRRDNECNNSVSDTECAY